MTTLRRIELGPDLLFGAVPVSRDTAFTPPVPVTSQGGIQWWISATRAGPPIDPALVAQATDTVAPFVGSLAGSTVVAYLSDYWRTSVHVITAVGAQIIDSQDAVVVYVGE